MNRYRIHIIIAVLLVFVAGIAYLVYAPGVRITLRTTGREAMRDVAVHVTGRTYSLGDLAPGTARAQKVSPASGSHVEVEFTDEKGRRLRLDAGGYFEPGYRGEIDIEIRDGKLIETRCDVRVSIY